jgi:hypothetical protein
LKKIDLSFLISVQTCHDSHLDLDESDCEIDHLALGYLCGDLTKELMDDNNPLWDLSSKHIKKCSGTKKRL